MGILASLFAGPISWLGYTILLIPAQYGKEMDTLSRIGCVLLCIPFWFFLPLTALSRTSYIILGAPAFYALLMIAFSASYRVATAKSEYQEDRKAADVEGGPENSAPSGAAQTRLGIYS